LRNLVFLLADLENIEITEGGASVDSESKQNLVVLLHLVENVVAASRDGVRQSHDLVLLQFIDPLVAEHEFGDVAGLLLGFPVTAALDLELEGGGGLEPNHFGCSPLADAQVRVDLSEGRLHQVELPQVLEPVHFLHIRVHLHAIHEFAESLLSTLQLEDFVHPITPEVFSGFGLEQFLVQRHIRVFFNGQLLNLVLLDFEDFVH